PTDASSEPPSEPPDASSEPPSEPPDASSEPPSEPPDASSEPPSEPPDASSEPPSEPPDASSEPPSEPSSSFWNAAATSLKTCVGRSSCQMTISGMKALCVDSSSQWSRDSKPAFCTSIPEASIVSKEVSVCTLADTSCLTRNVRVAVVSPSKSSGSISSGPSL